jgi:hypothetical protein
LNDDRLYYHLLDVNNKGPLVRSLRIERGPERPDAVCYDRSQ